MFNHSPAAPIIGGFDLLPDGDYELRITDTKERYTQKDKFQMVNVTCEVINNPTFNGKKVFHNVIFMPKDRKGSGMSTHFLKTINQSWEGEEITVDPIKWVGETFRAKIGTREYENQKTKKMVKSNDLQEISKVEEIPF